MHQNDEMPAHCHQVFVFIDGPLIDGGGVRKTGTSPAHVIKWCLCEAIELPACQHTLFWKGSKENKCVLCTFPDHRCKSPFLSQLRSCIPNLLYTHTHIHSNYEIWDMWLYTFAHLVSIAYMHSEKRLRQLSVDLTGHPTVASHFLLCFLNSFGRPKQTIGMSIHHTLNTVDFFIHNSTLPLPLQVGPHESQQTSAKQTH